MHNKTANSLAKLRSISRMIDVVTHLTIAERQKLAATTSDTLNLAILATDRRVEIRCEVLRNSAHTSAMVRQLAKDNHIGVRAGAAASSAAKESTLRAMAQDMSEFVRAAVAGNVNASAATLDYLSMDESELVLLRVARNSSTSTATLRNMVWESRNHPDIRRLATQNLKQVILH